ncbi:hypothetical protein Mapa_010691 [Marchantia paleacea]|nr:hypothetical protein Mapa_010691 [Marchantia paleacea]
MKQEGRNDIETFAPKIFHSRQRSVYRGVPEDGAQLLLGRTHSLGGTITRDRGRVKQWRQQLDRINADRNITRIFV